ncbi:MAG: hypothetical protein ABIH47_05210 [Candidatus Omnitrophota bacterium]
MTELVANERSYFSYVELSGICWGSAIVLYHQEGYASLTALVMLGSALSVQLTLLAKKFKLSEAKEPLFSLKYRYGLIIMDFLLKYCVYGLGACVLNTFVNPVSLSMHLNFQNGLLVVHAVFILIIRFFYSTFSHKERAEFLSEAGAER